MDDELYSIGMWFRVKEIVKKSLGSFSAAPFLFLLVQIPEAIIECVEDLAGSWIEGRPVAALILLIPAYCLSSAFASAFTFCLVDQVETGKRASFSGCLRQLKGKGMTLILSSFAVGLVVALGIAAMFLPAIYFMAVYVFVPYVIADGEASTVGGALARSKRLVGKNWFKWCCVVTGLLAVGLATYFGGDYVAKSFNHISPAPALHLLSYLIFKLGLSLCLGAAIDLAFAHVYLKLKGNLS